MSKAASRLGKTARKVVEKKVNHGNKLRTYIPAGMAAAGPPLGPTLGQLGINITTFCKDFNEKTKDIKEGIPLPTRVRVNPDRSYSLVINKPPVSYYLKQAAGITRGAMDSGQEIAGKVTRKHIYEIAKIKMEDPTNELRTLEEMCVLTMQSARTIGIEVVDKLDPIEYGKFLEERAQIIEQQKRELQEKKEAKLLRTGG